MTTERMHDTISFDAARVALKGASDLADSVKGGLKRGDRARITVEGVVTERKEITRTNGLVEWVKVIEVDTAFGLEVLDRLSELPFADPVHPMGLDGSIPNLPIIDAIHVIRADNPNSEVIVKNGRIHIDGKPIPEPEEPSSEPLTVDSETGEVISSRAPGKAKEPARGNGEG